MEISNTNPGYRFSYSHIPFLLSVTEYIEDFDTWGRQNQPNLHVHKKELHFPNRLLLLIYRDLVKDYAAKYRNQHMRKYEETLNH